MCDLTFAAILRISRHNLSLGGETSLTKNLWYFLMVPLSSYYTEARVIFYLKQLLIITMESYFILYLVMINLSLS